MANDIKQTYADKIEEQNGGKVEMRKVWKHNPSLSKIPRLTHASMDGVSVPNKEKFLVPNIKGGRDSMSGPHDPQAPPEQVIGCNCDIEYFAKKVAI